MKNRVEIDTINQATRIEVINRTNYFELKFEDANDTGNEVRIYLTTANLKKLVKQCLGAFK